MSSPDCTHDPALRSWVPSAREAGTDFPIQNLPLGVLSPDGEASRGGVAIGERILDIRAAVDAGHLRGKAAEAATGPTLNPLLIAMGRPASSEPRAGVSALLREGSTAAGWGERLLVPMAGARMQLPATVANFTDFMVSYDHCHRPA